MHQWALRLIIFFENYSIKSQLKVKLADLYFYTLSANGLMPNKISVFSGKAQRQPWLIIFFIVSGFAICNVQSPRTPTHTHNLSAFLLFQLSLNECMYKGVYCYLLVVLNSWLIRAFSLGSSNSCLQDGIVWKFKSGWKNQIIKVVSQKKVCIRILH